MVLGSLLKVINLNILPESSRNELKYSLKIAFMFFSIILKFQVPDINILLGIQKKATFVTLSFLRHAVRARAFKIVQIFSVNRDEHF